jgi:hypothetical protein
MRRPRWETSFPDPHDGAEDDPGTVGRGPHGLAYHCLDCAWTGRGGAAAYDHHRDDRHHRLAVADGTRCAFGCCQELAADHSPNQPRQETTT